MILTGDQINAQQAEQWGLVSKVVDPAKCVEEALKIANKVASYSSPVVQMAKEAVLKAYTFGLDDGIHFEKRIFHSTFALHDRKEGMTAFANKRKPDFKHK